MCTTGHTVFKESCKNCKSIRAEWYQYLSRTGFTDIEDRQGNIKGDSFTDFRSADIQSVDTYDNKQSYYQWARSKVQHGRFDSTRDKLIWEYHSEAVSTRQIAPRVGLEQSWVVRKINRIKSALTSQLEAIGSMSMEMATY